MNNRKLLANETVSDFFNALRRDAERYRIEDQSLLAAFFAGLPSDIAEKVMAQNPQNSTDAFRHAKILYDIRALHNPSESKLAREANVAATTTALNNELRDLKQELTQIRESLLQQQHQPQVAQQVLWSPHPPPQTFWPQNFANLQSWNNFSPPPALFGNNGNTHCNDFNFNNNINNFQNRHHNNFCERWNYDNGTFDPNFNSDINNYDNNNDYYYDYVNYSHFQGDYIARNLDTENWQHDIYK